MNDPVEGGQRPVCFVTDREAAAEHATASALRAAADNP
jgi:hypothetical protein